MRLARERPLRPPFACSSAFALIITAVEAPKNSYASGVEAFFGSTDNWKRGTDEKEAEEEEEEKFEAAEAAAAAAAAAV